MTGKEIYELGLTKEGQEYKNVLVPKNDVNYKGPWDCAEFTSWLVYQVSHKLYGCDNNVGNPARADAYTGYWRRDAETIGKIITENEAAGIMGAAVLRTAPDGQMGHVVISDGKGGTIEANGTKTGVIRSKLSGRRWDYGILVPWISYDVAAVVVLPELNTIIYRYTIPMMVNAKVGEIQTALKKAGFDPFGIDNIYGRDTAKAVQAFQHTHDLVADGEAGPKTLALLFR